MNNSKGRYRIEKHKNQIYNFKKRIFAEVNKS